MRHCFLSSLLNPTFNMEEVTLSREVTYFLMEGKEEFHYIPGCLEFFVDLSFTGMI